MLCHGSSAASPQVLFPLKGASLEVNGLWLSTVAPTICLPGMQCGCCSRRSSVIHTCGYTVCCLPKTWGQDGRGLSCTETGARWSWGILNPAALSWGWGGGSWWPGMALPPGPLDLAPPGQAQFIFTSARHPGSARLCHLCRVLGICPQLEGTWLCLPDPRFPLGPLLPLLPKLQV